MCCFKFSVVLLMVLIPSQGVLFSPGILPQAREKFNRKAYIIATHIRFQDKLDQFFWGLRQDNKCTSYTFEFDDDNEHQIKIFKETQITKSTVSVQEEEFILNNITSLFDYTWKDSHLVTFSDPGYTLIRKEFPTILVIYKEINTKGNDTIKAFATFIQATHFFKQDLSFWWNTIVELTTSVLQPTKLEKSNFARSFEMYLDWCGMPGTSFYDYSSGVPNSAVKDVVKILMCTLLILVLLLLVLSTCNGSYLGMCGCDRNSIHMLSD